MTDLPNNRCSSVSMPLGHGGGITSESKSSSHVELLGCFFAGISLTEPMLGQNGENGIQPESYICLIPSLVSGSNPGDIVTLCLTQIVLAQPCLLAHMSSSLCHAKILHSTNVWFSHPCRALLRCHGLVSGDLTECCKVAKFGSSLQTLRRCIKLLGQIVGCLLAGVLECEVSFCQWCGSGQSLPRCRVRLQSEPQDRPGEWTFNTSECNAMFSLPDIVPCYWLQGTTTVLQVHQLLSTSQRQGCCTCLNVNGKLPIVG